MFSKSSLDVQTLQHWGNTQQIFPEYCVPAGYESPEVDLFQFKNKFPYLFAICLQSEK